jgi:carbohydrate kinase (thermoresistant glucokinase family)
MGVSGSGKSTVGKALSARTGIPYYDADDYHPPANVDKMAGGQALNDDDRQPWLERLALLLYEAEQSGEGAILACSALKEAYRKILQKELAQAPTLVYLKGSKTLIADRMRERKDHFMPTQLLDSQFAALEEPAAALVVSIDQSVAAMVAEIIHPRSLSIDRQ